MNDTVAPQDLALQRLYHWEKTTPDRKVFTQPMGAGVVREMSWREVVDETRRMAAKLCITPLGMPVVPEVYMMVDSSAPSRTGSPASGAVPLTMASQLG